MGFSKERKFIKSEGEEVSEPASLGFILQRESKRRKRSSAESLETVFILTTKRDHSLAA